MSFRLQKDTLPTFLGAMVIPGLSIYSALSFFLVPVHLNFPISVLISILSLGLTRYYSISNNNAIRSTYPENDFSNVSRNSISNGNKSNMEDNNWNVYFTLVYLIFLSLCLLFSKPNVEVIYASWDSIEISNVIELGTGLALAFFMPGYIIVLLLSRISTISSLLKVLLSYLFSMLITGLSIYISSLYLSVSISELKSMLIGINLVLLLVFIIHSRTYRSIITICRNINNISKNTISNVSSKFWKNIRENFDELIVFGSLFGLLIIYTYGVYGGVTIGDQWYHQNRALLFMSGQFKESTLSNWDDTYPPFQSALLAGVTALSGSPLVNTYVSIAFLNMTAVFAFYYFLLMWLPSSMKRAALVASSLFLIGSGFDWTYILYSSVTDHIISKASSIATFFQEQIRSSDIIYSSNFMIAAFPDFSTALIYISLPAGFVLLGLIRLDMKSRLGYAAIISIITILGIMSQPEFYIFIVISSILPVVFKMKVKNFVYLAFLFAFAFAYIIDSMIPIGYFSGNKIWGIPLINIGIVFVLISWTIYAIPQKLGKNSSSISIWSNRIRKKLNNYRIKRNYIPKAVMVSTVIFLYAFSFVVWSQIPPNYIDVHRDGNTVPWYFYPMRLGVVGLIGLASILSYLFKRFEREIFVFGIVMIIAFLIGPLYDEQRLTKYLMAGMIGFASILLYKIFITMANKRPIIYGMIVGVIVLSSSLSTFMFVGYNAQVMQTHDYSHALGRRNFPSTEELNMLEFMRSKINGSSTDNIAAFPYEYNPWEGYLVTKLHAFSGLPLAKTFPSSLILNASTIDSFYNLLDSSNTKYIVMPSNSTNDGILPYPTRFALQNFEHIYQDSNYQVLQVPSLKGPSSSSYNKVGILYSKDQSLLSTMYNDSVLLFNDSNFQLKDDAIKFVHLNNDNHTEKDISLSNKGNRELTPWSKELDVAAGINYLEVRLRILGENKTGEDLAGLKWSTGGKDYFLYLSNEGLQLRQQSQNNSGKTLFSLTNTQIEKNDAVWHRIGVASLEKSIKIYVDNIPKITIPKAVSDKNAEDISKIVIYSVNSTLEVEPVKLAKIPSSEEFYDRKSKYDYDYAISSLALSGIGYESYADDDYSLFSKRTIILPFDPVTLNNTIFNKYIDYVKSGGTLVVMNSNDNLDGTFSKVFSLRTSGNNNNFSKLSLDNENASIIVSGTVKSIQMNSSSDVDMIASYRDKENRVVAPLAIEKHLPDGGKIVLINNKGYFDAIYDNPREYFLSLSNFLSFFDLGLEKAVTDNSTEGANFHFIGDGRISGMISVNGSLFLRGGGSTNNFQSIDAGAISVFDRKGNLESYLKNVSVTNMQFFGQSEASITTKGNFTLPLPLAESYYDYIRIPIPNGFDMTISLLDDQISQAQIVTRNVSSGKAIEIQGGSSIVFHNISNPVPMSRSLSVLVKSPEIVVIGNTSFDNTNYFGKMARINDVSFDFSGKLKIKFGFTDQYNERYSEGIRTDNISYINLKTIDGKVIESKNEIKIPGDISLRAKQQGLVVPIIDIFASLANLVLLGLMSFVTILVIWLLRKKKVL